MKRSYLLISAVLLLYAQQAAAFCGFYVAKADASLFNESSQIIIVRNGEHTTITMSSDYKGSLTDFAMVVPVPEVLSEDQIRVVNPLIFDKLDAYSAPRIVEYYDNNPCYNYYELYDMAPSMAGGTRREADESTDANKNRSYGVTVEATYSVGEYDILILSAKESDGLKQWLLDNDYKVPATAEEVLDPYIKGNLKFFVVKVNLEKAAKNGTEVLNPIQISFNSNRFMLPIRLGMANAHGPQDMIVYAFSSKGRIETANYRTVKIPSNMDIPLFVQQSFSDFYVSMFDKSWVREGKSTVFLEYSWDVSPSNYVKCDPCVGEPPVVADLKEAGVDWLGKPNNYGLPGGQVYFTRLHVRYSRDKFPQDLFFQETPNKENFQGRYVTYHTVDGDLDCDAAQQYYQTVYQRRLKELQNLGYLTSWNMAEHYDYVEEYGKKLNGSNTNKGAVLPDTKWLTHILLTLLIISGIYSIRRTFK